MTTPRERLIKLLENAPLMIDEVADYLLSHGWIESGAGSVVDTGAHVASVTPPETVQPQGLERSDAPVSITPAFLRESEQAGDVERDGAGDEAPTDHDPTPMRPAPSLEAREQQDPKDLSPQTEADIRATAFLDQPLTAATTWRNWTVALLAEVDRLREAREGITTGRVSLADRTLVEAREPLSDALVEEIVDSQAFREGFFRAAYNFESAQDEYVARCALVRAVASALRGEG